MTPLFHQGAVDVVKSHSSRIRAADAAELEDVPLRRCDIDVLEALGRIANGFDERARVRGAALLFRIHVHHRRVCILGQAVRSAKDQNGERKHRLPHPGRELFCIQMVHWIFSFAANRIWPYCMPGHPASALIFVVTLILLTRRIMFHQ